MSAATRRTFLSTAAVAAAASVPGCTLMSPAAASILKAAPYVPSVLALVVIPDAELLRYGRAFDRALARHDVRRARIEAGEIPSHVLEPSQAICEARADRVMSLQPITLAGLALWARVMLWRFDPTSRSVRPAPAGLPYGEAEAYALALAIDAMTKAARS